jgi:hypothetical protein
MALYVIRLVSSRHLPTVLGGRTRTTLRQKKVPIWLEESLDEEGRRRRRRLAPLARQLRADGVKVRWRGAKLEQLRVRAAGRKEWVEVDPLPPQENAAAEQPASGGALAEP